MNSATLATVLPLKEKSTIAFRTTVRPTFWVMTAALVAFAIKIGIAWNTFGTNDVIAFYQFGVFLQKHGLEWTYKHEISFNHPPLIAYFLLGIYKLAGIRLLEENGISFPFLLRLPGIIADLITVGVVVRIAKMAGQKIPTWALVLFALSPVSVMVSGFHGNTDPLMVMFLALAALMCLQDKPMFAGLFFALSCQVKIVSLLLLPIFFFYWQHRHAGLKFLGLMTLASVSLWGGPLLHFPIAFAKNVLSYGSFWGIWGVTYWLRLSGWSQFDRVTYHDFTPAENVVGAVLKLLIIAAVLLIAWRRRSLAGKELLRSIGYAWLVFFIFSPGVCAQYLVWLMPFVLLLSPNFFAWFTATSSLFLFFFYNSIADKFPWYIGISRGSHNPEWTPWSAWPWATLIIALVIFWKNAKSADASLRLFSFATLRDKMRE